METGKGPLAALAALTGRWQGTASGRFGAAEVSRTAEYILDRHFLRVSTRSVSDEEVHEDIGLFSHDAGLGALVLREFHSEGYVNTYRALPDAGPGVFVFDSEHIENPYTPSLRARLTIDVSDPDSLTESLALGTDRLEVCVEVDLHRIG